MLKTYGILKGYNVQDETYEWALRANIVIDKQGVIQLIDEGDSAVDPNTALTMCTTLHKKSRREVIHRRNQTTVLAALAAPLRTRTNRRICLKHSTSAMRAEKSNV